MVPRIQLLFAVSILSILVWPGASAAQTGRPYTVEDMLAIESVGKVVFDPTGERIIIERNGRFDKQASYARQFVPGETMAKLYVVDIARDAAPAPLFKQEQSAGYTIAGISPDGRTLAISRLSDDGLASGFVSVAGGNPSFVDVSPAYRVGRASLSWLGRYAVMAAGAPGKVDPVIAMGKEQAEQVAKLWQDRNRGDIPTARAVGSGRFASLPESRDRLVMAEPGKRTVRTLIAGRYGEWFASADGRALAALREEKLILTSGQRIDHGANSGGVQRKLVILDPRDGARAAPLEPCHGCDILDTSLNWSAAAPLLSYVARERGGDWSSARHRIYDQRTGEERLVDLGPLRPYVGRTGPEMTMASAWIGDRLAVLAYAPDAVDDEGRAKRADWYLVGQGAPVKLTGEFAGPTPELIALGSDSLVLLHGGDAWRVDSSGHRRNLTESTEAPVTAWREPGMFSWRAVGNRQPQTQIVLQQGLRDGGRADRLLFVDIDSGRIDTVSAPSSDTRFLAASANGGRAVVAEHDGAVTTLTLVDVHGGRRELLRLNDHLRGAVGGTPVQIAHKGPKGDSRISWLLLPPGHKAGQRVPTVVDVYPGWAGGPIWSRGDLDVVHARNAHVLAAHGYAVLFPSLPIRLDEVPRDPLTGMTSEVFAAVDAAIAKGYVDGDRMAIQGQSYGGYAASALIGMTDRFKVAVASAGLYDLISAYGQIDIRRRLEISETGLDLFSASVMETSQGGMGAPPWDDPQRYMRNSPLMLVKNVNTPILLMTGDLDYLSTTQADEYFTALTRLNKDAQMVRYFGEDHVYNSPANIRDMWRRIFEWYDKSIGTQKAPSTELPAGEQTSAQR